MNFKDQSVIITGAGSGIGKATALKFAQDGAKILVSDINEKGGQETVSLIQEKGGKAIFLKADVSRDEEVRALINTCITEFGSLDILINNAGIGHPPVLIEQIEDKDWDKVVSVNQSGVFYGMRAALKIMREQKKGSIVNVSSMAGRLASPRGAGYSASKFAVIGLTKAAAVEYGKYGIRVNAICPSFIETPLVEDLFDISPAQFKEQTIQAVPLKRLGTSDEIANAICWLSSAEASYLNGVALPVDGGFRL